MYNIFRRKAVAVLATLVAATAISTTAVSANPFEFFGNSNYQPVQAPAYADPNADSSEMRADLKRQIVKRGDWRGKYAFWQAHTPQGVKPRRSRSFSVDRYGFAPGAHCWSAM